MSDERKDRAVSEQLTAQRFYALLYKLSADVARLDTMIRTIKKLLEDKDRT